MAEKPKKPTEEQLRESLRAAAAVAIAPNSFEVNAKAEHARNPVRDFFDDATLRAKMNHSRDPFEQKTARAELAARRAKVQAAAARNSDAAKRNAPRHVKLARIDAHLRQFSPEQLEALEETAWYRNLAPYGQGLVDEALEKIRLEEYQSDPVMAAARLERYGSEPTAEQEPAFRFESPDAEATLALEQWLDDDSGFVDEPGAERSLGEVYDDEYADALAEYGDVA
jgi:hypothetical protein